jgi:hypothetical protein
MPERGQSHQYSPELRDLSADRDWPLSRQPSVSPPSWGVADTARLPALGVRCDFPPAWSIGGRPFQKPGHPEWLAISLEPVVQAVDPNTWAESGSRYPSLTPQAVQELEGLTRRQRDAQAPVFLLCAILEEKSPPAKLLPDVRRNGWRRAFGKKIHRSRVLRSECSIVRVLLLHSRRNRTIPARPRRRMAIFG